MRYKGLCKKVMNECMLSHTEGVSYSPTPAFGQQEIIILKNNSMKFYRFSGNIFVNIHTVDCKKLNL